MTTAVAAEAAAGPVPVLRPDWPAVPQVGSAFSLRGGGVSVPPFDALNLGTHVGDDPAAVAENRRRLRLALGLAAEPLWLAQQHGTRVVDADRAAEGATTGAAVGAVVAGGDAATAPPPADAAVTRVPGRVLAVLVADCLPVLFARRDGTAVGIAHAGWRGLAAGVLEATVEALDCPGRMLQAWLGPAIGREQFEVGDEVRAAFCTRSSQAADAFERNAGGRWQCDLHLLARQRLAALGIHSVHGQRRCSYALAQSFYSYRRDGITGRMAALVWLQGPASA
jgi:YfiH family protein